MAFVLAPSLLLSSLNATCEERTHTSQDHKVVNLARAEAQISEVKSKILLNTQMIEERNKTIERLRIEQQELLSRLAGFESLALKTMEKLSQAENFIDTREERLNQSLLSQSMPGNKGPDLLSSGPMVDRGSHSVTRLAGLSIAGTPRRN